MLGEQRDPINSGLRVAAMNVEACGFHGTPTTRHHVYRTVPVSVSRRNRQAAIRYAVPESRAKHLQLKGRE
jgi:hypothetical protein